MLSKHDQANSSEALERRTFLKRAGSGLLAGTVVAASARCTQTGQVEQVAPPERSELSNFPTLSNQERDRRWEFLRQMMQDHQVEGLLVPPGQEADTYITNDAPGQTVIFPLEGEPTAIGPGAYQVGSWLEAADRGENSWVQDWHFHPGVATIVEILQEKGLTNSRIGTIGAAKGPFSSPRGSVSYNFWTALNEALPGVTFEELWDPFVVEWLTKSEEDQALFRQASAIIESAADAMLEFCRPGVNEADIYAACQWEIQRHGARTESLILFSGPDTPGHGRSKWLHRAQQPRVIQEGDIINFEMFASVGMSQAQANLCIGVGEVHEDYHRAGRVARESYEAGVENARAGVKYKDLDDAMREPLQRAGAWHMSPLSHSTNPLQCVGVISEGVENMTGVMDRYKNIFEAPIFGGDIVLRPGMCFQLEPCPSYGRRRGQVGGNVIVREDGPAEELNTTACEFQLVSF